MKADALAVNQRRDNVKGLIQAGTDALQQIASELPPAAAGALFLQAASRQPELLQCSNASIWNAIVTSVQLALPIGGPTGQLFAIPYRNRGVLEANPQLGYKGLVTLFARAGVTVMARLVYEGEPFGEEAGSEPKLKHIPIVKLSSIVRAELEATYDREFDAEMTPEGPRQTGGPPEVTDTGVREAMNERVQNAYAVARHNNRPPAWVIIDRERIDTTRRLSRGASRADSPWNDPFSWPAMARKTAILRLQAEVPIDTLDFQRALQIERHVAEERPIAEFEPEVAMPVDIEDAADVSV